MSSHQEALRGDNMLSELLTLLLYEFTNSEGGVQTKNLLQSHEIPPRGGHGQANPLSTLGLLSQTSLKHIIF